MQLNSTGVGNGGQNDQNYHDTNPQSASVFFPLCSKPHIWLSMSGMGVPEDQLARDAILHHSPSVWVLIYQASNYFVNFLQMCKMYKELYFASDLLIIGKWLRN